MAGPFAAWNDLRALFALKVNQPPTAGSQGQVLTRDTSSSTGTSWQTPSSGGGGSASDATATSKGVVQLAGDLAGTAAAPTLKTVLAGVTTVGASDKIPVVTFDANGRATQVSSVGVTAPTVPDATSDTKGLVRLAGDLAGSAASPALAPSGVQAGVYGGDGQAPVITVDSKGRVTAASVVTVGNSGGGGSSFVRPTINSQTGTAYSLTLSDENNVVENSGSGVLTVTVPSNANVPFPVGSVVEFTNYGTGSLVLSGGTGSQVVVASDTFTGTDGAALSSQWTQDIINGSTGAGASILSNKARLNSGSTSGAYGTFRLSLQSITPRTDTDVSCQVTFNQQANTTFVLGLNADYTFATQKTSFAKNGYAFQVLMSTTAAQGSFTLYKIVNDGALTAVIPTTTMTITSGVNYGLRVQRIGTAVRVKIWDSSQAEPAAWTASATDASNQPAAGRVYMGFGGDATASETADVDNFMVTNGASNVVLRSPGGKLRITDQYGSAAIRKRATDEWVASGDLVV